MMKTQRMMEKGEVVIICIASSLLAQIVPYKLQKPGWRLSAIQESDK